MQRLVGLLSEATQVEPLYATFQWSLYNESLRVWYEFSREFGGFVDHFHCGHPSDPLLIRRACHCYL